MTDESSKEVLPPSVEPRKRAYRITGNRSRVPPPVSQEVAREIEARFWPKVRRGNEDECWPWQASKTKGYGMIFAWGRPQYAHRVAYALQNGSVPEGADVLHKCDNPPCCNGKHLFLGDQLANMRDRNAKGRANYIAGEQVWSARITAEIARAIYDAEGTYREIAEKHSVSLQTVHRIKAGQSWRAVTGGVSKARYNNVRRAIASRETKAA